jgi:hypothetical protein
MVLSETARSSPDVAARVGAFPARHEIEEHPHRPGYVGAGPVFFLARERNLPRRPGPATSSASPTTGPAVGDTLTESEALRITQNSSFQSQIVFDSLCYDRVKFLYKSRVWLKRDDENNNDVIQEFWNNRSPVYHLIIDKSSRN